MRRLALAASLACALAANALHANNLVDASLVAEPAAATPGVPFSVAVRLRVPEGWHLSWKNPGDAGLVPKLTWTLPPEVSAGAIEWPVPFASVLGPVTSYAMEGEVWLLVELVPARALPLQKTLALAVDAEWLVCKELCIPERAHLEKSLPVAETLAAPGVDAAGFLAARSRLPRALNWTASLAYENLQTHLLELRIETGKLPLTNIRAQFFPDQEDAIAPSAPQELTVREGGLTLKLIRPDRAKSKLARLSGVLVLHGSGEHDEVAVQLATTDPTPQAPPILPLWLALICAFAGGLLLNLMPCVLPVLGFKVLGLLRDASAGRRRARIGGLAYSAGVIVSFWILAALLAVLRASGEGLGWGFQLQSPAVVSLLALLFFALGLSFLGLVPIGLWLQTRAGSIRFSDSGWGAFASGILATAVATPCTAPFMGVALGAAVVSPPLTAWAIFTALGVGMAWPYAALSLWPSMLKKVPRPGLWTERLQQALAFPLFATVLWLLSVLAAEAGSGRVLAELLAILLAGFSLWLWRSAGAPHVSDGQRKMAALASLILLAFAVGAAAAPGFLLADRFGSIDSKPAPGAPRSDLAETSLAQRIGDPGDQVAWRDWSEASFAQLRAEGRVVFVDFTAAWCISCEVNERVVFSSPEVRARFAALHVVALRADWTRSDPLIAHALESFGRTGVPLNLLAGPRLSQPLVLPTVLTPGTVLSALDQAGPAPEHP